MKIFIIKIVFFFPSKKVHVLDLNNESNIDMQTEMDKMLCGIARIWVHPDHRRTRIATKLLDCIR